MHTEKKEWVLTGEAFEGLLKFLHPDPNLAASEYEQIRQRLMKLFRWRGCLSFEEYTDMTVDRVARRIAEGVEIRTANPHSLFYGVAMNLLREHWRKSEREGRALDQLQRLHEPEKNVEDLLERREEDSLRQSRVECARRCLRQLPSESLMLIKRYYAEGGVLDKNQRKQVADALKISVNALRVRAFRIRAEVEKCVHNCVNREGTAMK